MAGTTTDDKSSWEGCKIYSFPSEILNSVKTVNELFYSPPLPLSILEPGNSLIL